MTVYIDKEYKCHASPVDGLRDFDVLFFEGKCPEFIEGYRYVPSGESWMREDGVKFNGEMIAPWRSYTELYIAQLEYELADADAALNELGMEV